MKRLKIALVGYGYWGPNVAKNLYKNENFDFCLICDKRLERLELARKRYAGEITYTQNFNELLEDKEITAIALAVETSAHFSLAREVLLAGKHLYVEKPFTSNSGEAKELQSLAKEKGLIIHVDHIMIYHPVIRKIKEILERGDIGDIIYFDCSRINLGNIKNDVSSMWDLSVHDLSVIDYLTNGEPPVFVHAVGEKVYSKKQSITFLTVKYNNFLANIKSSWLSPIKERKLIIVGTRKMIVYDDVDVVNKLIVYDKGFDVLQKQANPLEYEEFVIKSRCGDGLIPKIENGDALFNSLEHFRKCILEKKESESDAGAAIRIIKILEEADKQLDRL